MEEILKKYNTDINKEFDLVKPILDKHILEGRTNYHDILKRMYSFYIITQYISNNNNFEFKGYEMELVGILNKIELNFWGIYSCLKNGALIEAMIIKRSMLESVVTLDIILKENTVERLKLYSNFKHILRWKQIEKHEKLDEIENIERIRKGLKPQKFDKTISSEMYNSYKKSYEILKDDYPNKSSWYSKEFKGGGMKNLCDYLGGKYPREYIAVYGTISTLIHGGSNITDYYSEFSNPKGNVITNMPRFDDLNISIGVTSIELCSRSLLSFLRHFKFLNLEHLDSYIEIFVDMVFQDFSSNKHE